jgi:hypothetical protein
MFRNSWASVKMVMSPPVLVDPSLSTPAQMAYRPAAMALQ